MSTCSRTVQLDTIKCTSCSCCCCRWHSHVVIDLTQLKISPSHRSCNDYKMNCTVVAKVFATHKMSCCCENCCRICYYSRSSWWRNWWCSHWCNLSHICTPSPLYSICVMDFVIDCVMDCASQCAVDSTIDCISNYLRDCANDYHVQHADQCSVK